MSLSLDLEDNSGHQLGCCSCHNKDMDCWKEFRVHSDLRFWPSEHAYLRSDPRLGSKKVGAANMEASKS